MLNFSMSNILFVFFIILILSFFLFIISMYLKEYYPFLPESGWLIFWKNMSWVSGGLCGLSVVVLLILLVSMFVSLFSSPGDSVLESLPSDDTSSSGSSGAEDEKPEEPKPEAVLLSKSESPSGKGSWGLGSYLLLGGVFIVGLVGAFYLGGYYSGLPAGGAASNLGSSASSSSSDLTVNFYSAVDVSTQTVTETVAKTLADSSGTLNSSITSASAEAAAQSVGEAVSTVSSTLNSASESLSSVAGANSVVDGVILTMQVGAIAASAANMMGSGVSADLSRNSQSTSSHSPAGSKPTGSKSSQPGCASSSPSQSNPVKSKVKKAGPKLKLEGLVKGASLVESLPSHLVEVPSSTFADKFYQVTKASKTPSGVTLADKTWVPPYKGGSVLPSQVPHPGMPLGRVMEMPYLNVTPAAFSLFTECRDMSANVALFVRVENTLYPVVNERELISFFPSAAGYRDLTPLQMTSLVILFGVGELNQVFFLASVRSRIVMLVC